MISIVPHRATRFCVRVHCDVHEADEELLRVPYIRCPHCNHAYKTKHALRWAYRKSYWYWEDQEPLGFRLAVFKEVILPPRAKDITFCPLCAKDFVEKEPHD